MAKTVEDVTKALKLKAQSKNDILTIKLGSKKLTLPFEARLLSSDQYLFVHLPPAAAIFKFGEKGLEAVVDADEARQAQSSFRKQRFSSGVKAKAIMEIPEELKSALSKIPAGYRLAIGSDGKPRIVKTRVRRKS